MDFSQQGASQIKELLRTYPRGMTVKEISSELEINRNSVAKYLDILLVSGQVEKRCVGPAKVYFLSHRVPISALLNFSSEYLMVLDKDLKIVQMNDIFLDLMDVARDVLIGQRVDSFPHPFFALPEIKSSIRSALNGKESTMEESFRAGDARVFFRIKFVPTTFDDGSVGVTMILEDITEHRKAEIALSDKEKKYRALVENIPGMAYSGKPDWSVEIVGPGALAITAYSKEDFEKKGVKWIDIVHPDDKERVLKEASVLDKKETDLEQEYRIIRKDGKIAWIRDNKHSLHKNGRLDTVEGVIIDITERRQQREALKEREKRYREIFELSPGVILLLDKEGIVLQANQRLYELLSYKPEEIIGKHRSELPFLSKESTKKILNAFSKRLAGEKVPPYPLECTAKGGKKLTGKVFATFIKSEEEEIEQQLVVICNLNNGKK